MSTRLIPPVSPLTEPYWDAARNGQLRVQQCVACKAWSFPARANCPQVFPNYDARFRYPDKIGQIKLFRKLNIAHPASELFLDVASFHKQFNHESAGNNLKYPLVFKLDWDVRGQGSQKSSLRISG